MISMIRNRKILETKIQKKTKNKKPKSHFEFFLAFSTSEDNPTFEQLCRKADGCLFDAVLANPGHVLNPLLPPVRTLSYSLRPRPHDQIVPRADNLMRKTFLTRMLYLD